MRTVGPPCPAGITAQAPCEVEDVMDDIKRGFRDAKDAVKREARDLDGHQPKDDVGNLGDDARADLGNAGDDVRRGIDDNDRLRSDTRDDEYDRGSTDM
jgi:hypothetical protein